MKTFTDGKKYGGHYSSHFSSKSRKDKSIYKIITENLFCEKHNRKYIKKSIFKNNLLIHVVGCKSCLNKRCFSKETKNKIAESVRNYYIFCLIASDIFLNFM
jgi:hypothetical protein